MLDIKKVDFLRTAGTPINGNGVAVELRAQSGKGYEIVDGGVALNAGTKKLQGSVCGNVWTDIVAAISGDVQGAIADQYHYIRLVLGTYVAGDASVLIADPRQE